jgi:hypothetical protein
MAKERMSVFSFFIFSEFGFDVLGNRVCPTCWDRLRKPEGG